MLDVPAAPRLNDARARRNNLLSASIVSIQQSVFVYMSLIDTANLRDVPSRHAYNEQQLVSRLIRGDVFHSILLYLSDTYPPDRSKNAPYVLGWICATHICSSMRNIALEISALWARHVCAFGSQEAFEELSKRAKETPIAISNVHDYSMDNLIKIYTVPEHYLTALREARCGSLSLNLESTDVDKVVRVLGNHKLPYLHTVDLRCTNSLRAESSLDSHLHAVQLRHVTLFNVYVQVAGQSLVSIDLDGGKQWLQDVPILPTESQLLEMLEGCSNLQSLRLRGAACRGNLTKTVHLPALVELVLIGSSALSIASQLVHPQLKAAIIEQEESANVPLLQALSLPRCREDFWSGSAQSAPKLCVLTFGHQYNHGPDRRELLLSVRAERWADYTRSRDRLRIILDRSRPPYNESTPPQPQLEIAVTLDEISMASVIHTEMLETVVRAQAEFAPFMLHAVEILHLATYPAQVLNWRVLCDSFLSVHTLHLGHEQPRIDADDGLLAALAQITPEGDLVLPKLRTLVVNKRIPWRPRDYARFREMLTFRARHGGPVLSVRAADESLVKGPGEKKYYDDLVSLPATVE